MPGRTARQCRDRYKNYLMESLVNAPWSPEEDAILLDRFQLLGPKWVEIGKLLHGRSGNNVKNRWYKHLKKASVVQLGVGSPDVNSPPERTPESPELEDKPKEDLIQPVEISDGHWEQLLAAMDRNPPCDSLWSDVFSFGEPFP
jgi:hypothetical protein